MNSRQQEAATLSSERKKPRVIICDPISEIGINMLKKHCAVDIHPGLTPIHLKKLIPAYDAAIVRSRTKFTREIIEAADRLKVIGRAGAGLDSIDLDAAEEKNIQVVNSPNANTVAVAEHTFALMLSLVRQLPRANAGLKKNRWEKSTLMGTGLAGKTLGLVGFGRIAKQVASRALAFGMIIMVAQRKPTPKRNSELGVETVGINTLFKKSDFISLHIPGTPENKNFVNKSLLALTKPSAFLINTSRGIVIDEEALLEALEDNGLAGAALDVFKVEPAVDNPLVQHQNVIVSPHIAASTDDAQQSAAITIVEQILDILIEPQFENPLNLAVVPLDKVFPHELTDPRRVNNLIEKINSSEVFTNPPIVFPAKDYYVVLDGATRIASFKKLGFPHVIVQVLKDRSTYDLGTWFHAIRKIDVTILLELLKNLPGIMLVESEVEKVQAEILEHGGLCYLQTIDNVTYHIQPEPGVNHIEALNLLTDTYIKASHVTRTLHADIEPLLKEFPDLTGVVVFPVYTLDQILQITDSGNVMPSGITRSIIPGRVMRLNADFDLMTSDMGLEEKNKRLYDLVMDKLANDQARYYAEPIYLLDE